MTIDTPWGPTELNPEDGIVWVIESSTLAAGGCWEWKRSRNVVSGYGQLRIGGVLYQAHRVAWEAVNGPIPSGDNEVDHVCRNRACINPAHLRVVSHRENIMSSPHTLAAINAAKTHAPCGHPLVTVPGYKGRRCELCWREKGRKACQAYYRKKKLALARATS